MLLQELAGKNAEMMEEVERVRLDLNSRIERRNKEELTNRISTLEKELSGQFEQTQRWSDGSTSSFAIIKFVERL